MNPFETVEIGNTGVAVTRLGLGGAPLSGMVEADGLYGGSTYGEALAIIRRAHELGVRYFDSAPFYGAGHSEARYGAVLPELPREGFAISTKAGRVLDLAVPGQTLPIGPDGLPHLEPRFDMSRDGIMRSLDESLERLRLDRIDVLFVHDPDMENGLEAQATVEAFPTLVELREQGVVKAIGCGMNQWQMPARFVKAFDLDVVLLAGRFTLLDHDAYGEFLPLCVERNVKLVIGGPYNSGILARDLDRPVSFDYELAPEQWIERARSINRVCDRHGVDLKSAALQYPLAHPAVASVIPGAQSVTELEENARVAAAEIPVDLWAELKYEKLIPEDAPTP